MRAKRYQGHDQLTKAMEPTSLNLAADYMEDHEPKPRFDWFGLSIIIVQIIFIVFFFVFCRYTTLDGSPYGAVAAATNSTSREALVTLRFETRSTGPGAASPNSVAYYWGSLRDVAIMMLIGFGYLMTFLKRHRFSAIGYTFMIVVLVVQWNILVTGFYTYVLSRNGLSTISYIYVGFPQLVLGLFSSASVLISFGVWIGKVGPEQLLFMSLLHVLFYTTNSYIIEGLFELRDVGGSLVIHMFGAYFGLAAGRFISPADTRDRALYAGASYTSDTFSMIGTLFLWICWPSFNAALVPEVRQYLAIFNTFLSLVGATMMTFATSRMLRRAHHFTMEDLQNATLAGGVAMGASADILVSPGAALLIGCLSGALSVFGFAILGPILQRKLRIYDTCGVHNLHGMPSILGAVASAIVCSQVYVFGTDVQAALPRGSLQWGYQLASMCVTLLISIASGLLCGWLCSVLVFVPKPKGRYLFDDSEYFEVPDVFEAGVTPTVESVVIPDASAHRPASSSTDKRTSGIVDGIILL